MKSLNAAFAIETFLLLLLTGIGPKIALVPFLETTRHARAEQVDVGSILLKKQAARIGIILRAGERRAHQVAGSQPGIPDVAPGGSRPVMRCSPPASRVDGNGREGIGEDVPAGE